MTVSDGVSGNVSGNVSGVVLAAGSSRRFGDRNKLLLEIEGEPLVRRVVRNALASELDEVVVVVGHQAEQVWDAVADLGALRVENPDHAAGQSTSVRSGLAAVGATAAAALFIPADLPFLSASLINRLIGAWKRSMASAVVPTSGGERRAPVLFARHLFPDLEELRGDLGGRKILRRLAEGLVEVPVEDRREVDDIDRPADGK